MRAIALIALLLATACGFPPLDALRTDAAGAQLVAIDVMPTSPSLPRGTTAELTATGRYSDDTTQDLTLEATWSSGTTTVATVSLTGVVTAADVGTSLVAATMNGITGSTTISVTAAVLKSLEVTPDSPSIPRGLTKQFIAMGTLTDGSSQDLTADVIWSSGTSATATISNTAGSRGLASSANVGSTTITAAMGAFSDSTTLTVTPAVLMSIDVTPSNPAIPNGSPQQFTATGILTDGTTQPLTTTVTWASDTPATATISNATGTEGLATSANPGTTMISATKSAISGSTILTVTN